MTVYISLSVKMRISQVFNHNILTLSKNVCILNNMGVKIFLEIRKKLGVSAYEMAKRMGYTKLIDGTEKPDVRPYLYKERTGKQASASELIRLQEISGLSDTEFMKLLRKTAKKD